MIRLPDPRRVSDMFEGRHDTLIRACLSGFCGGVWTDDPASPRFAVMVSADFTFFAGIPDHRAITEFPWDATAGYSILVPPDGAYLGYFDFKTLTCLFCVLSVVCALWNINFFYILACRIVKLFRNARLCVLALVYITFIGSMLIANDMALITFLPLGYFVLHTARRERYMAVTFILQNIAANLGGMLTPFGNPQNLYLYSHFSIPTGEFMSVMFPPFVVSILLITLCCLLIKPEPMSLPESDADTGFSPRRALIYLALFALSIVIVFRVIPYWIGLAVIPLSILLLDRKAMRMVDYPLLLTFVCFFIFSGNMARIDAVRSFFSALL